MGNKWLIAGAISLVCGCPASTEFECGGDDQCVVSDIGGTCEPSGFCSWPDNACPSGRRYGEFAPKQWAGACVEEGQEVAGDTVGSTTSGTTTGAPTSSTGPDGSASSSAPGSVSSDGPSTSGGTGSAVTWWDGAWSTRHRIDVVPGWTEDDLRDVPVLVALDPGRIDFAEAGPAGAQLRFVDQNGAVELPYEIEIWEVDRAIVWVQVPDVTLDGAHLWLYLGNPAAADGQAPPEVWSNGYLAVWHMGDTLADSGGGGFDATNMSTTVGPGFVGGARSFDGNTSAARVNPDPQLTDVFGDGGTISAWIYPTGWGGSGEYGRILDKATAPFGGAGHSLMVRTGRLRFVQGHTTEEAGWDTPGGSLALDRWSHVAITHQSADQPSAPAMYIDGSQIEATIDPAPIGAWLSDDGVPITLGALNDPQENRTFQGSLDEIRISSTRRSAAWIAVQVASMSDALLEYGPAESSQ